MDYSTLKKFFASNLLCLCLVAFSSAQRDGVPLEILIPEMELKAEQTYQIPFIVKNLQEVFAVSIALETKDLVVDIDAVLNSKLPFMEDPTDPPPVGIGFHRVYWDRGAGGNMLRAGSLRNDETFLTISVTATTDILTSEAFMPSTPAYRNEVVYDCPDHEQGLCSGPVVYSFAPIGLIVGSVRHGDPSVCEQPGLMEALHLWQIQFTGDDGSTYRGNSSPEGDFSMALPRGSYSYDILPSNPLWTACNLSGQVELTDDFETIEVDIVAVPSPMKKAPFLHVDLSVPYLERCRNSRGFIDYHNAGTHEATAAFIDIQLDAHLKIMDASNEYSAEMHNIVRFEIGDLDISESGRIWIDLEHDCQESLPGQTHCSRAIIQASNFAPESPISDLIPSMECEGDSILLRIENTGDQPTLLPQHYIVIEDILTFSQGEVDLDVGEVWESRIPTTGASYRMEVEQEAGNPIGKKRAASLEGCSNGSFSSLGFINQLGDLDDVSYYSQDCQANVLTLDANTMEGLPIGVGSESTIDPNQLIEYKITFQNRGENGHFYVKIRDTLDPHLDLATLQPGASSHPYSMEVGNGTIDFIFDEIELQSTAKSKQESLGFLKFKVRPKEGTPLGTVIQNKALIHVGPLVSEVDTVTTQHTLGIPIKGLSTSTEHLERIQSEILIAPNPVKDGVVRVLSEAEINQKFILYNLHGQEMQEGTLAHDQIVLDQDLQSGLYFLTLHDQSGKISRCPLIICR